jgi:septal ring factor EnvC (AmiA/AmiB activator)
MVTPTASSFPPALHEHCQEANCQAIAALNTVIASERQHVQNLKDQKACLDVMLAEQFDRNKALQADIEAREAKIDALHSVIATMHRTHAAAEQEIYALKQQLQDGRKVQQARERSLHQAILRVEQRDPDAMAGLREWFVESSATLVA